jgi:hypothetical protein
MLTFCADDSSLDAASLLSLLPIEARAGRGKTVKAWKTDDASLHPADAGKIYVRLEFPRYSELHLLDAAKALRLISKHLNLAPLAQKRIHETTTTPN